MKNGYNQNHHPIILPVLQKILLDLMGCNITDASNPGYSWIIVSIILNRCCAWSACGLFAGMMII